MFSVKSSDAAYNSPMIGNGEVVTMIGPTGYHGGACPPEERVNRTIFWAGRRLGDARSMRVRIPRVPPEELIGPTIPLIRFGRMDRSLEIGGRPAAEDGWEQTADFEGGRFVSVLHHGDLTEATESLVCLTRNVLVFRTRLENTGASALGVQFTAAYTFGDAEGERPDGCRLHIRRPHPDDLGFSNVEGTRSRQPAADSRPPHEAESLSVQYEIEGHLGEVRIGRFPVGTIRQTEAGGRFIHSLRLEPGGSTELWFWIVLSDRTRYQHFPDFRRLGELLEDHRRAWGEYWQQGRVRLGAPELDGVRSASLYTLRCYSSPWSLPPGYLSTHWEGRVFHDELYPFLALLSGGHTEMAAKIPGFRLLTLPGALKRGAGRGAHYGWEVTEEGEESAPYGHWVDEQFVHGGICEQAWRLYLASSDLAVLEEHYPVIRGCARWLCAEMLVRDVSGRLTVRETSDVSEHVTRARNSIYTAAAVVRSLEVAARASELVSRDAADRSRWSALAAELEGNLPSDPASGAFRYADDVDIPAETAHLGIVFPFSAEVFSEASRATLARAIEVFRSTAATRTSDQVFSYNWIWALGRLAAACFYLGRAEEGFEVLGRAAGVVGPFMAPNEHLRPEGAYLPWFGTGAGAIVYAINAMFVQVFDEEGAILLPAVPSALSSASFEGLLATHGVRISGSFSSGSLRKLTASSERSLRWRFRLPEGRAAGLRLAACVERAGPVARGLSPFVCALEAGRTELLA